MWSVSASWPYQTSLLVSRKKFLRHSKHLASDFGGIGPLMLLWHGAGCDLAYWETLSRIWLASTSSLDLPEHGRSSPLANLHLTLLDKSGLNSTSSRTAIQSSCSSRRNNARSMRSYQDG